MLLIGPPCSGKSAFVLRALERAIRADRGDEVRLLVPTGSMKHHLLNVLARRDLMVPSRVVLTMSELVREKTPALAEAGGAAIDRLLGAAIASAAGAGLGPNAASPGLRARLAALIGEFWAAGADSFQVESAVRDRRQRAFVETFVAFESALARSGFAHGNQRIAAAAARIRDEGLGAVRSVYVDGFDRFTKPQEELLAALAEQAEEIVIAMPDGLPRYPLRDPAVEQLAPRPGTEPRVEAVAAASPRAEVIEIARRILGSSRPLSHHGVVLRSPDQYRQLVREVFGALSIPYRLWEREPLARHGVVRHFIEWLRVIDAGFPGGRAIEAIASPLTPAGTQAELDAFDFAVRERLPGSGLDFLVQAGREFEGPRQFLETLRHCEGWRAEKCAPARWAERCQGLLGQVQRLRVPLDSAAPPRIAAWRKAVSARQSLGGALRETPDLPDLKDCGPLLLSAFVDALEDVLRFASLAPPGNPRDVVHVLPILESRQWSLPVAFVCGMVDGWFPRRFSEDGLFDDADRRQLRSRGIELRTSADRGTEERFLFRIAESRATERLVLTYPRHDATGRPLMRSALLGDLQASEAPRVTLGETSAGAAAEPADALPAALHPVVAASNRQFSVSGVASYRQCPYQYFSDSTLKLRGRPNPPERRLGSAEQGTIVHHTLLRWNREKRPIGDVLDDVFRKALRDLSLPASFRTERIRQLLRADLLRFAHHQGARMAIYEEGQARFEDTRDFRIEELDGEPVVRCRIDRYDMLDEERCIVTDYKYAAPHGVRMLMRQHRAGERLQLMTYLAALEQGLGCKPTGMALYGLRQQPTREGLAIDGTDGLKPIEEDELRELLDTARAETADAVGSILEGAIAVRPRDTDYCGQTCKFGGLCRIGWAVPGEAGKPGEVEA